MTATEDRRSPIRRNALVKVRLAAAERRAWRAAAAAAGMQLAELVRDAVRARIVSRETREGRG